MRIIQLMPTITYGDAVSNHALAIAELLKSMSYETAIYVENTGNRLPEGLVRSITKLPRLKNEDIVIYHASTASGLNYQIPKMRGRKIMIYHNITPPHFFHDYSPGLWKACTDGLEQMRYLADKVEYCIADSEFNKKDLQDMGFTCPIDVCPLLIEFSDYAKEPDARILNTCRNDGYTNLLFVGRIAPNKKQENVIRTFYFYHKYFNKKSRLFLVGNGDGLYLETLRRYVCELGLQESVIFPGHIRFDEILAYYRVADAFVCMSEHEGFCVPLTEAMYFDVPIIAYGTTAIPETLGGSGVLLESNAPIPAAEAIDKVMTDDEYRKRILQAQRARLKEFAQDIIQEKLKGLISEFIDNG